MEKERAIQCVPVEMLERLKALAERLWADNNPSSVHLSSVLEEFEPDIKALGQIVKEYETEYSGRVSSKEGEFSKKEARLKEKVQSLTDRVAALEGERVAELRKIGELKGALKDGEAKLGLVQSSSMELESELNLKYVAKMQELYDRVNKKEMSMLTDWEEKNRSLESRQQAMEGDHSERMRQLKFKEKALEEDAKARKAELIRTFDRIREDLDARERAIAARERALAYWDKAGGSPEAKKEGQ
ncbi:MAG TPA: hypothetical protein DCZ92_15435 [Elusimicrobia bacterium]|nr:MAG: hypothetical protein A2016_06680 [Elusimicrobia bacterium GWF2_62_30]HBA62172.1 hypothetical protein [Elusimicrobiota bacterium]